MAAASPQGTPPLKPFSPVHPEENTTPPVDDPPSEEDPQLRDEPVYQQLALPQVLTELFYVGEHYFVSGERKALSMGQVS